MVEYKRAPINRGSLAFCIDDDAMQQWFCTDHHGDKGHSNQYSDKAIETALMLKGVFNLSLRLSQFTVSPGYSCLSKGARTAIIKQKRPSQNEIAHLAIDSTGVKTFG